MRKETLRCVGDLLKIFLGKDHKFCKALDAKKDVRIVFCYISKAFDKVWHQGLLYKLRRVGIKGDLLNWFKDYLSDREQRVVTRG